MKGESQGGGEGREKKKSWTEPLKRQRQRVTQKDPAEKAKESGTVRAGRRRRKRGHCNNFMHV